VRCALAKTEAAPEVPWLPRGRAARVRHRGRGRPVPDEGLRQALHESCRIGLHLTSSSEHDRKRGAFDPEHNHLPLVFRAALRQALGLRDGRPGVAVLQLVCRLRKQGLCLHDGDSGQEAVVGLAKRLADYADDASPNCPRTSGSRRTGSW
jgi:hypothetical protein